MGGRARWRRRGPGGGGGSSRSARPLVGAIVALCALELVAQGCVIADPPTDLPRSPERRPTIVRSSVVPAPTAVLATWPTRFIIPVELSDPRADLQWASFVDYNPVTGAGFDQTSKSRDEPAATTGNVRTLDIPITTPASDGCHVVEVVVALRLNTTDPRNAHTPEAPGGDSVSWFYSPSGDVGSCPVLDAGLAPLEPDAEASADGGGVTP